MTHPAYLLLGLVAGFALGVLVGWDYADRWHERRLQKRDGYREPPPTRFANESGETDDKPPTIH